MQQGVIINEADDIISFNEHATLDDYPKVYYAINAHNSNKILINNAKPENWIKYIPGDTNDDKAFHIVTILRTWGYDVTCTKTYIKEF